MKCRGKSPSERFVSSVASFVAGKHLYGKPRPSTLDLMLGHRELGRQIKQLNAKYGLDGKPPREPGKTSLFTDVWDTLIAYCLTVMFASLRISIFLLCWGLLLFALPTVIRYL